MLDSAPVTFLFLIANVLVGVVTLFVDQSLVGKWAFRPRKVMEGEWWRFVTAGFVHVGIAHLAFNMITLYFFGPIVEGILGSGKFIAVYFGSELAANALTMWRHKDDANYSAVGASGAVSGVLFSFILFQPFAMLAIFFAIPMPAIVFAVLYVALSIYSAKQGGGQIAHEAHLGGALAGVALTLILYPAALGIFLTQLGMG